MQGKATTEIAAALKRLNEQEDPLRGGSKFDESFETLRDAAVVGPSTGSGQAEVVLVISDFRKFRFSLAELAPPCPPEGGRG